MQIFFAEYRAGKFQDGSGCTEIQIILTDKKRSEPYSGKYGREYNIYELLSGKTYSSYCYLLTQLSG